MKNYSILNFFGLGVLFVGFSFLSIESKALASTLVSQGNVPICNIAPPLPNLAVDTINIPVNENFCTIRLTGNQNGLRFDYQLTATSTNNKAVIAIDPFVFQNISGGVLTTNYIFPVLPYNFNPPQNKNPNGTIQVKVKGRFTNSPGDQVVVVGPNGLTNVQAKGTTTATTANPNMVMGQDGHLEADAAVVFVDVFKQLPVFIAQGPGILMGEITLTNMPVDSRFVSSPNTLVYGVQTPEPTTTLSLLALGTLGAASALKRKQK